MLRLGYLSYRPSLIEKKLKWIAKIEMAIIEITKNSEYRKNFIVK